MERRGDLVAFGIALTLAVTFAIAFASLLLGGSGVSVKSALAVSCALLWFGCSAKAPIHFFADASQVQMTPCYSAGKMVVMVGAGLECPPQSAVTAVVENFITTAHTDDTLNGAHILFIQNAVLCITVDDHGCTDAEDVLLQQTPQWDDDLRHQLGHLLRIRQGRDTDLLHYDCAFWLRVDGKARSSCKDLAAAPGDIEF